jgi:hypothetical protein
MTNDREIKFVEIGNTTYRVAFAVDGAVAFIDTVFTGRRNRTIWRVLPVNGPTWKRVVAALEQTKLNFKNGQTVTYKGFTGTFSHAYQFGTERWAFLRNDMGGKAVPEYDWHLIKPAE